MLRHVDKPQLVVAEKLAVKLSYNPNQTQEWESKGGGTATHSQRATVVLPECFLPVSSQPSKVSISSRCCDAMSKVRAAPCAESARPDIGTNRSFRFGWTNAVSSQQSRKLFVPLSLVEEALCAAMKHPSKAPCPP